MNSPFTSITPNLSPSPSVASPSVRPLLVTVSRSSAIWLSPGSGDLPSATSDADLKRNTVMAEVFQRLSSNPAATEKFEVAYGGKSFTKLDDFLGALKNDGYGFACTLETHWRGAGTPEASSRESFAGMKTLLQKAGAIG